MSQQGFKIGATKTRDGREAVITSVGAKKTDAIFGKILLNLANETDKRFSTFHPGNDVVDNKMWVELQWYEDGTWKIAGKDAGLDLMENC